MDINSVSNFAEEIHQKLDLQRNFNIEELVGKLGGRIEECKLPTGVVAQIATCPETSDFIIKISDDHSVVARKRFSIAHELGHLFLHMDFLDENKWEENVRNNTMYNRSGISVGREELEANAFAAAFLMPRKEFLECVKENTSLSECDINKIAKEFDVSYQSAYYRGINLGVWV